MSYTPGPWQFHDQFLVGPIGHKPTILACRRDGLPNDADWRLIEAAPDLLEAIEGLLRWNNEPWRKNAQRAIAKARGEQ